eukprot:266873-Pleurochrysis_carterae.AAC.1
MSAVSSALPVKKAEQVRYRTPPSQKKKDWMSAVSSPTFESHQRLCEGFDRFTRLACSSPFEQEEGIARTRT